VTPRAAARRPAFGPVRAGRGAVVRFFHDASMPKKNLVYIQSLRNGAADRAGQPVAYQGGTRYMKAPLEFLVERLNDSPLGERYTLKGVIVDDDEGSPADRAKVADYGFARTPGRPWILPDGWHMDCGFDQATWPVPAVKLFAFVGDVGPQGGGTMLLSGTHRLVDRYRETLPAPVGAGKEHWRAFMLHHPWLARLLDGADRPDHGRALVGAAGEIDGVPVQIVELTGSPGDIVLTHLHVLHARSPNTGTVPRLMAGKQIRRA